jgi:hypothetical protein
MPKERETYKVWAIHEGRRTLMHVIDEPHGRERAMRAIATLKQRPEIDQIELHEHVVSLGGDPEAVPRARRGTLRWQRDRDGWRQVVAKPRRV